MLAPDPSVVTAAIETDKVMAMLDAEEVALAAKEAKRIGKILAEIDGLLAKIKGHRRTQVQAGQAMRGLRKHIRFLKYRTKRKLKPHYSIERRRNMRRRFIRRKVEKEYLREKALEFRATLKVNTRPYHRHTAEADTTATEPEATL